MRSPRADLHSAPGQPGHRPAGIKTGLRGARCTGGWGPRPAPRTGTVPGSAARSLKPDGGNPARRQSRSEAPEGERAPKRMIRVKRIVCGALPQPHVQAATFGCAARTMVGMRLSALRLPPYEPGANLKELCCCGVVSITRAQRRAARRISLIHLSRRYTERGSADRAATANLLSSRAPRNDELRRRS